MAGLWLSNAVHAKDNAEQQGAVEQKKYRERNKSPLLNNALFYLGKSSTCSTVQQKAFQRSAVMAECLIAAALSMEPCTGRVR